MWTTKKGSASGFAVNNRARLAGFLYFLLFPTTGVWFALTGALTAGTINRTRLQLAIVAGAFGFVDFLILGVVLYQLFSPAAKTAAGILLALVVASATLSLAVVARQMDVLSMLDDRAPQQVTLALRSATNLFLITDIFSGLWLLPLGWLGMRSGLLPRAIGYALMAGSVFYVATFVGTVVDPAYASTLAGRAIGIVSGVPGFLGEVGTMFWLMIFGARTQRATVAAAQPAGSLSDL